MNVWIPAARKTSVSSVRMNCFCSGSWFQALSGIDDVCCWGMEHVVWSTKNSKWVTNSIVREARIQERAWQLSCEAKSGRFECVISRKLILQFPLILIHLFTYLLTLKNRSVLTIYQSCPCGLSLGIHERGALETRLNDLSQKRISISSFVYLRLTITPNEYNHYVNTLHLSCLYPQKTSTTLRSMAMVLLTAWEFLTTTDP